MLSAIVSRVPRLQTGAQINFWFAALGAPRIPKTFLVGQLVVIALAEDLAVAVDAAWLCVNVSTLPA